MSRRRAIEHPQAAQLLAFSDGELRFWQAWRVRRHVEGCWQCRGAITGFDTAMRAVSQELSPLDVAPVDLAKAKWKFRAAVTQIELEVSPQRRLPWLVLGLAAGLTVVAIGILGLRTTPGSPSPSASGLLAAAMSAEAAPVPAAVWEDRFTVEYRTASAETMSRRELRLLSAPAEGVWTARWSDERGELQNAVFASQHRPGAEFTRAAGLRPTVFPADDNGPLVVTSHEDIEQMVLGWIRRQVWQPVSLARELAEFCTRSGAVLKVSVQDGAVLWTAEAVVDGVRFAVELEGMQNQEPRVLRIAWSSNRGDRMLRLTREGRREYPNARMAARWLYPPEVSVRRTKVQPPVATPDSLPVVVPPATRDLIAAEVDVLVALHQARLCNAGEFKVVRSLDAVTVSGMFADGDTVARIGQLLSGIPNVRLQTSVATAALASVVPPDAGTDVAPSGRPAAAEKWLRGRLGVGTRSSEREMFNSMNAVVRDAEALLSDSWALFHLANRFPPEVEAQLETESLRKLRSIVGAHVVAVSGHLGAIDGRLALPHGRAVDQASGEWQASVAALHQQARQTAEVLLELFASGDAAGRSPAPADPEQAGVGELLGRVRSQAVGLQERLADDTRIARQQ